MFDKWIEIAKKYGGVLENVEIVSENDFVKVISKDIYKKSKILLPNKLLIPKDKIILQEDKHYIEKGFIKEKDLEEMLNEYLDFIFSENRIKFLENFLKGYHSLPLKIKEKLLALNITFERKISKKYIKELLLHARLINRGNILYFFPFINFVNHSFEGNYYIVERDFIAIESQGSKEVFALYNMGDTFSFLKSYFFPEKSVLAYSVKMGLQLGNKRLIIKRNFKEVSLKNNIRYPIVEVSSNNIEISYFMLGNKFAPRRSYFIIRDLFKELGLNKYIKIFSLVQNYNINYLGDLLENIDNIKDNLFVEFLKQSIFHQLKLIGESFIDE